MTDWWLGLLTGVGLGLGISTWLDWELRRKKRQLEARLKAQFEEAILARHLAIGDIERRARRVGRTYLE